MIKKEVNCTAAIIIQMALQKIYEEFKLYKISEYENGFYIDFYSSNQISINDFPKITKEINKIISGGYQIEKINNLKNNNLNELFFKVNNKIYSTYGESLENTNKVKKVLLTQIGGVNFIEEENEIILNRIYVSAFQNDDDLNKFNKFIEEIKIRDHRKIGEDLKIFTFNDETGLGFPIWLPNGNYIKEKISNYLKNHFIKSGFKLISTPILGTKKLYEKSGHWELYKENNFPPIKIDNEVFMLRPMTCPHHMIVFNSISKSYRDLPYKISEDSKLFRYESSGGLIGLERVRSMELFDSHIFCSKEMIKSIIFDLNNLILKTHKKLGIKIDRIDLSLKSDNKNKYFDDSEMWKNAENQLRDILKEMNCNFVEIKGEAAFYGPKIDYQYKTVLGKWITISTIQLDFLLPKKFNCLYKDSDGEMKNPILIHFGVIGTYERFISVLLSQTKGILPFWLSPTQIIIIPVNNMLHLEYANFIKEELIKNGFNVEIDDSNERFPKKIRNAQISKVPFNVIIGDKEIETKESISFREYQKDETTFIKLEDFIENLKKIL